MLQPGLTLQYLLIPAYDNTIIAVFGQLLKKLLLSLTSQPNTKQLKFPIAFLTEHHQVNSIM